jgi:hypothetical protein
MGELKGRFSSRESRPFCRRIGAAGYVREEHVHLGRDGALRRPQNQAASLSIEPNNPK